MESCSDITFTNSDSNKTEPLNSSIIEENSKIHTSEEQSNEAGISSNSQHGSQFKEESK